MTTKNTLLIDAGNSKLKWSLITNEEISDLKSCAYPEKEYKDFLHNFIKNESKNCDGIIAVSVRHDEFANNLKNVSESHGLKFSLVTSQKELAGITSAYEDPSSLGSDRLVAMIGALSLVQSNKIQSPCLIIDSGTATTIDAIDMNGKHLGGVIFPGFELNEKSLLSNTDLLPILSDKNKTFSPSVFSNNTSQAISSGCLLANSAAIDDICDSMEAEIIKRYKILHKAIPRFICGGGASKILPFLKDDYRHEEKLLMTGLKRLKELGLTSE